MTSVSECVLALELGTERREVVDLAVEDDPHRTVFVRKGLLSGGDVDDAQPAMGEADTFTDVETVRVGSAMSNAVAHRLEQSAIDRIQG